MNYATPIFKEAIQKVTRLSKKGFAIRSQAIHEFRTFSPEKVAEWDAKFERAAILEKDLETFLNPASEDAKKLQEDAFAQLSFQDSYFKSVNYVPFALTLISLFKIWAVPCMAVITPILAWIIPYFFLKFIYKLPISQEQYGEIMKFVWAGNPLEFMKNPTPKSSQPWTMRGIIQMGVMALSFLNGLVQPIQNAMHLYKTDQIIVENGKKLIELEGIYNFFETECEELNILLQFRTALEEVRQDDPRLALHFIMDQPERYRITVRDLADLEIQWRIAHSPLLQEAMVLEQGAYPLLQAEDIFDVSLGEKAIGSSISFTGASHHAALTGPNGGGKSSFLRAVLQCVLLSQAYGVAPAARIIIRRFGWICSGLRLQDAPGDLSMFETEVWFAANLLNKHSANGPGLVLYDELFHSTNPPDGIRTAELFLQQMWKKKDIVSIISTHVFSIVEKAPENVQRLCCDASEEGDVVKFKFHVQEGICRVSSVQNIWDRFGLRNKQAAAATAPAATAPAAVKPPAENLKTEEK